MTTARSWVRQATSAAARSLLSILLCVVALVIEPGCVTPYRAGAAAAPSPASGAVVSAPADANRHFTPVAPAVVAQTPVGHSPSAHHRSARRVVRASRARIARIRRLTAELAETMRAGKRVLAWCAGEGAGQDGCTELTSTATRATLYIALAAHPWRFRVAALRRTLERLTAELTAARALEAATVASVVKSPAEDVEAELTRYADELPGGAAQHSVPALIPWHASTPAVLTVENVPGAGIHVPRLSARLTVLDGDAVRVIRSPPQVPLRMTDGSLKWVWMLEGMHEGRAEIRMELFIDPPPGTVGGIAPLQYKTWEDDVTVQPSVLASMQEVATGTEQWLFGGIAQSVRTAVIATLAAGLAFAGYWAWRRPQELRSMLWWKRRSP